MPCCWRLWCQSDPESQLASSSVAIRVLMAGLRNIALLLIATGSSV